MRKLIVTFFGSGLSPVAPGTAGSLATVVLLALLSLLDLPWWTWQVVLLVGLIVACVFAIGLGEWAVAHFGREDPQPFVLDEVAGICLTALLLPTRGVHNWVTLAVVFAAFRLFDVTKPPPARQLERLPAGWGILLDDLAAAVYANLLCQIVLRGVPPQF